MTPEQRAAFIVAQTAMMNAELQFMLAENVERARQCYAPANGPSQWKEFHDKWEPILGYNALIQFLT